MMKKVVSSLVQNVGLKCNKAIHISRVIFMQMRAGVLFTFMKKAVCALTTCLFALGGAVVGTITGAIKGQTTETGLARGAGIGAVVGAITAIQLMDSIINGEPFSKAALLYSLLNGRVFVEWASPALLKAYQWQVSAIDTSSIEIPDLFEVTLTKGLSQDYIEKLPKHKITSTNITSCCYETSCAICLQDVNNGDLARTLPDCRHCFHSHCIDEWLTRQGSCPICRKDV
ncbi:NEP1-interacting protein-like 1 [Heracleum sosnowskyi]|uniref:NEP1-interacting protein-like 1 n=1 Tax=Heracleum sosnowskyi TaxID=360622 RepID=A0AAD8N125_9APIA|nr:NEP1-interacting protein-like 1 [Heracleum sosnowskyi]